MSMRNKSFIGVAVVGAVIVFLAIPFGRKSNPDLNLPTDQYIAKNIPAMQKSLEQREKETAADNVPQSVFACHFAIQHTVIFKDPDSVQFVEDKVITYGKNKDTVVTVVRARNSFNGYTMSSFSCKMDSPYHVAKLTQYGG